MNILFYPGSSPYHLKGIGGAEVSMRVLARELAGLGEHVSFLAECPLARAPWPRRFRDRGVFVREFCLYWWPVLGHPGCAEALERFYLRQLRWHLRAFGQQSGTQIIYVFDVYPNAWRLVRLRKKMKASFKIVVRVSGLTWSEVARLRPEVAGRIREVLKEADLFNFVSSPFYDLCRREISVLGLEIPVEKSWVMDVGFDADVFDVQWRLPQDGCFRILMVGRFSAPQKRQDLLIKALDLLEAGSVRLDLVGAGPELRRLQEVARDSKVGDRVFFHGQVSREEIKRMMLVSHLFCLATNYEGVSKSLLEAMALGMPVLVSDVVPLNGLIQDSVNGYLCQNTAGSWASCLDRLTRDRSSLTKTSVRARQYVREHYDPARNAREYQRKFLELCAA